MEGPFGLTAENVSNIKEKPGVYVLGYHSENYGAYVGRSDISLRERMKDHLPEYEKNSCMRRLSVDRFWIEYTESALAAYNQECQIYHKHGSGYTCNSIHPSKSNPQWTCPVCGE